MTDLFSPKASELRFVARRYSRLQGLRNVTSGVTFLALGAFTAIGYKAPEAFLVLFLPFLVIAGACIWVDFKIKRWYEVSFGKVTARTIDSAFDWLTAAITFTAFVIGVLVANVTALTYEVAFALAALAMLLMALVSRRRFGGWHYHTVTYGLATALAALLAWGLQLDDPQLINSVLFGCAGLALIIGGLLDHRQLVRALGTNTETADDV